MNKITGILSLLLLVRIVSDEIKKELPKKSISLLIFTKKLKAGQYTIDDNYAPHYLIKQISSHISKNLLIERLIDCKLVDLKVSLVANIPDVNIVSAPTIVVCANDCSCGLV